MDYIAAAEGSQIGWDQSSFTVDGSKHQVVVFDVGASGWDDGLTQLHEDSTDGDLFVDVASRKRAIKELQRIAASDILEVGVSSGYMLRDIRAKMPRARLVGADYTLGTLLSLAKRMPEVPLIRFDLTRCPLPDQSFDAVVALNVLEHIEDDAAAVENIHRILRPGGRAVIEVPAGPELFDDYDRQLQHFRRYTLEGLTALFERAGFAIERRNYFGAIIYPAFRAAKGKPQNVGSSIERARRVNAIGTAAMTVESILGKVITFPAGVRCVLTARKI